MSKSESYKRAEMPAGTEKVLDLRSLQKSNSNLLTVLQPGQAVLDVGCGSGSITRGIQPYVGKEGLVVGVDSNKELIGQAVSKFKDIPNLRFDLQDILKYEPIERFDIVTASRTLQWMENPTNVVSKLKTLLKPDGILCILDYNHALIEWHPLPPQSMLKFFDSFLKWRADAGMDNEIGNHIVQILEASGMKVTYNQDLSEYIELGSPEFESQINIWTIVAETRGKQMVSDKYVTEPEREQAAREYSVWCGKEAGSMRLNLRATHAVKNASTG